MAEQIINLGTGFWNIRGTFRIGGILNIGTHCSLIQLASGRFVFLDSYSLTGDVRAKVMALTNNGQDVEAILNLQKTFHKRFAMAVAVTTKKYLRYSGQRIWLKVKRWRSATLISSFHCRKASITSRPMR